MCIEEVEDINDACEGNVPCHYCVVEEEVPIYDIMNLVLIEEKQGSVVTPFLTLLRHTPPTKETTTNPIIDYSWPLVMTSNEYMDAMAENARKKAHAENVRAQKKKELEATKKHQEDKVLQEAQKKERADQRIAKRKFDEAWSAQNCKAIGDALHENIKENPPIVRNMGRYCGWKHNMSIEIEKKRMLKLGLSIEGYNLKDILWDFKGNACRGPLGGIECIIVLM